MGWVLLSAWPPHIPALIQNLQTFVIAQFRPGYHTAVINLLLQFIVDREAALFLATFGFDRHREFRPCMAVEVANGGNISTVFVQRDGTVADLKAQMTALFWMDMSSVVFMSEANLQLNHTDQLPAGRLTVSGPAVQPVRPLSLVFAEIGLVRALWGLLDSPEVAARAWKLLQWLPDADWILPEMRDLGTLIEGLHRYPSNGYELRYRLQILRRRMMPWRAMFVQEHGLEVLVQHFLQAPGMTLLRCFIGFESEYLRPFVPALVPKVLEFLLGLVSLKQISFVVQLLGQLRAGDIALFSQTLGEHFDLVEKVVFLENESTFAMIREFLRDVPNQNLFFKIMLRDFTHLSPLQVFDVVRELAPTLRAEINMPEFVDRCRKILENGGLRVTAKIIGIMSAVQCGDEPIPSMLVSRAFDSGSEELKSSIFQYLRTPEVDSKALLAPYLNTGIEMYRYDPLSEAKSPTGLVGMRNLGATCYMNSVLQQLFAIPQFASLFLRHSFENPAELELQFIFAQLLRTARKSVDMRPFVQLWKGWGKVPVNPKDQQDANEFFQFFIDQLPGDFAALFKGTILTTIEGISEEVRSTTTEEFLTFGLNVKTFWSIEQSFADFLECQTFTGDNQYFAADLGKKIDARTFSRIKTAPPVFVIRLKRFEYDLNLANHSKISSYCKFPKKLDIQHYVVDRVGSLLYRLTGIVLHTGTAEGGHYIALVRREHGHWLCFDDTEVSDWNTEYVMGQAYGSADTSAYLLIYTQTSEVVSLDSLIPDDVRARIADDNCRFGRLQTVFSEEFCQFATECDCPALQTEYLFKVFCRSAFLHLPFLEKISTKLQASLKNENDSVEYVLGHTDQVIDVLLSHADDNFVRQLNHLLFNFLSPSGRAFSFAHAIVGKFDHIFKIWRKSESLGFFPARFVEQAHSNARQAHSNASQAF
jgi:ubiquitin C-terminal hydrolase